MAGAAAVQQHPGTLTQSKCRFAEGTLVPFSLAHLEPIKITLNYLLAYPGTPLILKFMKSGSRTNASLDAERILIDCLLRLFVFTG